MIIIILSQGENALHDTSVRSVVHGSEGADDRISATAKNRIRSEHLLILYKTGWGWNHGFPEIQLWIVFFLSCRTVKNDCSVRRCPGMVIGVAWWWRVRDTWVDPVAVPPIVNYCHYKFCCGCVCLLFHSLILENNREMFTQAEERDASITCKFDLRQRFFNSTDLTVFGMNRMVSHAWGSPEGSDSS